MPNGDPRDGFFYPTLTLMIDSYIVHERERKIGIYHFTTLAIKQTNLLLIGSKIQIDHSNDPIGWANNLRKNTPEFNMTSFHNSANILKTWIHSSRADSQFWFKGK